MTLHNEDDSMTTSDMSTPELDDNPIEVRISLDMVKRYLRHPRHLSRWQRCPGAAGVVGGVRSWTRLRQLFVGRCTRLRRRKISTALVMAATLFGYLIRLGLILVAFLLVRDASWICVPHSERP